MTRFSNAGSIPSGSDRGSHPALGAVLAGGGVIAAARIAVDAGFRITLAEYVDEIGPEAVQALHAMWSGYFWIIHVGIGGLWVMATSIMLYRRAPAAS